MKRIISVILAVAMMIGMCTFFTSCESKEVEKSTKVTGKLEDIYNSVNEKVDFDSKISDKILKETDSDNMLMMNFEICDMEAAEKMTDYFFTMPSDYCNTFAVFMFDEGMPSEEGIKEMKDKVRSVYTEARVSALQMYMPEEYQKMKWAVENEDLTWREYDNALVFIITGDSEPKEAFDAFEEAALK